ncbi:hypothetical protein TrLO_g15024 [Triparma laevis f. longispina]|uniref:Dihydrolipoamide acetyltransferase component of pyruvate dehydrogenase complex n=1 Tax=Triparma laevis f. longispina TaxID=1714387 RepID=A0A9W6ZVI5_9STRA|nr:hypothetical protein TrLO_g15024 [Triparma laevis f. longispina]
MIRSSSTLSRSLTRVRASSMRVGGSYVKSIINGAVKPSVFSTKSLNKYGLSSSSNFYKTSTRAFSSSPNTIPFLLADIGEGIAEVELLQWFVEPGDDVKQFDRICEVQSDKATVEITCRYDGKVASLHGEVGGMMNVGEPLIHIEVEGGEDSKSDGASSSSETIASSTPGEMKEQLTIPSASTTSHAPRSFESHDSGKVKTTPVVRKLAREHGIDLAGVVGSGPKGRVLKEDVLNLLGGGGGWVQPPPPAADSSSPTSASKPPTPTPTAPPLLPPITGERREPVRGMSRLMIKSMNESLKIPHFGYSDEISMNALHTLRNSLKPFAESQGIKLSYMPIMIKAASIALMEYPIINSSLSEDEKEIVYHNAHNIGVAMDTPRGLVVPNIKSVQTLSVIDIARELQRLQLDGQTGSGIKEADLKGSTFTLSNIGAIGGTYMSPVISKPQVAIGALGKIQTLPRFDSNGEVVAAKIMEVSWAGDHRTVDGATMARFSNLWKDMLENPSLLMANMK